MRLRAFFLERERSNYSLLDKEEIVIVSQLVEILFLPRGYIPHLECFITEVFEFFNNYCGNTYVNIKYVNVINFNLT